ncbi:MULTISPECIES: winged helix-turn-helix transcriptional regulator [Microvirga]|uniref:winged helix-turn-helix transcriptional regulator n=1 Tax=Microvirga TaxID=186650 RepID=UPI0021C991AA|nr:MULTISPECIES: winged helix-turn-helix transcriptional regulator [unclassified Microvirga]
MKLEKITEPVNSRPRRRYDDACATAHALDLVGERWALLVMRELMLGPKRFGDLRESLPGISANVLTQRLEGLEASGILVRRRLPPPAAVQVYELTEWGYESEPIFQALGRWAARSPSHDPTLPFSTASLVLSMRTMFDAGRAGGLDARIGLRVGEETFLARLAEGRFAITHGSLDEADVILSGIPPVLAGAIYGGQTLEALEQVGALQVEGDRALADRFVSLFPLPTKASRPA